MNKRTFLRLFFFAEITLFSWFYFYGSNGVYAVAQLHAENLTIQEKIELARQEIVELEEQVIAWQTEPFFKEKIAREQLQLARESDEIYCTSSVY